MSIHTVASLHYANWPNRHLGPFGTVDPDYCLTHVLPLVNGCPTVQMIRLNSWATVRATVKDFDMTVQKAGVAAALPFLHNPATVGVVAIGAVGWGIYNLLRDEDEKGADDTVAAVDVPRVIAKA